MISFQQEFFERDTFSRNPLMIGIGFLDHQQLESTIPKTPPSNRPAYTHWVLPKCDADF